MQPEAYWYVLMASVAGGFMGPLVMWHRKRTQVAGDSGIRRGVVLAGGTLAIGCAAYGFGKAFGDFPRAQAVLVMVLMTGWAAVLQGVVRLPVPASVLKVGAGEERLLGRGWTGVRWFGWFLRNTPLRHLGGRVFFAVAGGDARLVLRGIHDAEAVHLWALLFSVPWLVYWVGRGEWGAVGCGLAVHVPLNVYPILHLRQVTRRVERCAARVQRGERRVVDRQV